MAEKVKDPAPAPDPDKYKVKVHLVSVASGDYAHGVWVEADKFGADELEMMLSMGAVELVAPSK